MVSLGTPPGGRRGALTRHDEEVEDVPATGEEGPEPVGEEVEGQLRGEYLQSGRVEGGGEQKRSVPVGAAERVIEMKIVRKDGKWKENETRSQW